MSTSSDFGKLLLRLTIGGLLIFHGIQKVRGDNGLAFIEGLLEGKGMPKAMAYGVYVGELLAPALVILGFQTRLAALVIAGNMVFAGWLAHADHVLELGPHGGWALESVALFGLGALSIALIGPGRFSIDGRSSAAPEQS